jgi:Na+/H+ antiporter NhaD/arsenite permease-like protein
VIALAIFLGTYFVLAVGSFPGLRLDRTGAAIIGASLMIGFNVLTFEEAVRAVDYSTLVLLFGMMIVVANLRLSGFFRVVSAWAVRHAHQPRTLLGAVVVVSGVFSAFFVNDTMCLVLTPLVLEVTERLERDPLPYLLGVAMASNAGSVATLTGNPQNMLIGSLSGISYRGFSAALAPVAAVSLALTFAVIVLLFPKEFRRQAPMEIPEVRVRVNRVLLWKALVVSAAMIGLFFWGWAVAKVAVVAGAVLLITRRVKPEKVYHEIDWQLLAMFAGLFIVVAGFEKTSVEEELAAAAARFRLDQVWVLSGWSALISNVVSNVPAVLLFAPLIRRLSDPRAGWLTLAMSSTLAGNLTLVGSVANLIVVQRARRHRPITFWEYCRVGIPVTLLTLAAGAAYLILTL